MKKALFTFLLLALSGAAVFAQSVSMSPKSQTKNTSPNTSVDAHVTLTNTTTKSISYRLQANPITSLPANAEWQMCFGASCFGGSPLLIPIASQPANTLASSGTEDLKFTYNPDVNTGTMVINFCVYIDATPADSACAKVTYNSTASSVQDALNAYKPQVTLSSSNPAHDFAMFNYELHPKNRNAEFLLTNSVGQIVHRQNITQMQGVLAVATVNLPDGVYFCHVTSQSSPVLVSKLVVSH